VSESDVNNDSDVTIDDDDDVDDGWTTNYDLRNLEQFLGNAGSYLQPVILLVFLKQ
jgi:hypothetical protein